MASQQLNPLLKSTSSSSCSSSSSSTTSNSTSKPFSYPPATPSRESSSPPSRSRHSTRSFTSLAPSDSRSNCRSLPQPRSDRNSLKPDRFKRSAIDQSLNDHRQEASYLIPSSIKPTPIPIGTRPEDVDLLSIEDPDHLFLNFTIREIRSIEQRARNDADQKREDLRQMVGERYRDLLGAADSIVRMQSSSQRLIARLDDARNQSDRNLLKLKASAAGKKHVRSTTGSSKLSYILATLVKLLLDLSEHIWRSLEREEYLMASRYESLGRIISNELKTGKWDESGETEASEVMEMFPIVERQSEMLSQLAPQISSRAKLFLRKSEAKDQAIMETLAALALIDHTSLLDSLQLLLEARKLAFNHLINRLTESWTEQVKNAVKLLVATMKNVEEIFLEKQLVGLLKAIQDGSSKDKHLKPLLSLLPNAHQLMRHIPRSIIDFCPFVAALGPGSENLQAESTIKSWFEVCQSDLVSYIASKIGQVQSTQNLVDFRHQLQQVIGEPEGKFQSTIKAFKTKLFTSLHKRFHELYQTKLNELQATIIKSLGQTNDDEKTKRRRKNHLNHEENWIFSKKLPSLESSDPTKFAKYLESIQERIEGKLIEDRDGGLNKSTEMSVIRKMEVVGKLLREDFESWTKTVGHLDGCLDDEDPRKLYIGLGRSFVENCLKEINQLLSQEIENSNLEGELAVGDLALRILSTRKSFMNDLCLNDDRDGENNQNGDPHQLIHDFQTGLNQILFDSSRHWSQSVVKQSIKIFKSFASSDLDPANNNHHFTLKGWTEERKMPRRPTDGLFQSLDFLSRLMMKDLGVHRLKAQRGSLLGPIMDDLVLGILDVEYLDLVSRAIRLDDLDLRDRLRHVILFDLMLLIRLAASCPSANPPPGLTKARDVLALVLENKQRDPEAEKLERQTIENVVQFEASIKRLWWPLEQRLDEGDPLTRSDLNTSSGGPSLASTAAKVPKSGGLACVKPGHRFALLSVY